jgi:hypothetical protein
MEEARGNEWLVLISSRTAAASRGRALAGARWRSHGKGDSARDRERERWACWAGPVHCALGPVQFRPFPFFIFLFLFSFLFCNS